jgi:hypothetical protein
MSNTKNPKNIGPQIEEPTPAEINQTVDKIKRKYDVVLNPDDAIQMAKLLKELEWWFTVDKFSRSPKSISIDTAKEIIAYFKKIKGKDLTLEEAHEQAKSSLTQIMLVEKERIAGEIRAITDKYLKS